MLLFIFCVVLCHVVLLLVCLGVARPAQAKHEFGAFKKDLAVGMLVFLGISGVVVLVMNLGDSEQSPDPKEPTEDSGLDATLSGGFSPFVLSRSDGEEYVGMGYELRW